MTKRKLFSVICAVTFVIATLYVAVPTQIVFAGDYSDGGCVSWAKARAQAKLGITLPPTGTQPSGVAGASNWWTVLPQKGYASGQDPKPNSLAIWRYTSGGYSNYGHVAYVESVNGNSVTTSEGGWLKKYSFEGNTGVGQRHFDKGQENNLTGSGLSGFLGYVYLQSSPDPTMTFQEFKVNSVSQTNAELYTKVLNPGKAAVTEVGCRLLNASGAALATYTEGVSLNNQPWIYITCDINKEAKYTLTAGTTYQAEFYAVAGGKKFVDQPRSFSTTAPADPRITFEEYKVDSLTETNAELYTKVMNPTKQTVTNVGCYLYDDAGTLLKKYSEDISLSTSYVNLTCNFNTEMGYTLEPGKNYKAVFYVIVGGKEYKDDGHNITTPKPEPIEPTVIALQNDSNLSISEDQLVTGIKAGDNTVQSLRKAFANSNLIFTRADGTELADTDRVGTGTIISIKVENEVKDSVTAVVSGDINGDGEIGTMDVTLLARHVLGILQLNEEQRKAGDVFADGVINNKDISRLLRMIAGKEQL